VIQMINMSNCRFIWKRRFLLLTLTLCFFVFFPHVSVYGKIVILSFEENVTESEAIVIGKVLETKRGLFRQDRAIFQTLKIIKGDFNEQEFTVAYGEPFFLRMIRPKEDRTEFMKGESYVLFLWPHGSSYGLVGLNAGYYHMRDGKVRHKRVEYLLEDFIKLITQVYEEELKR
jgi:hypothetical protein